MDNAWNVHSLLERYPSLAQVVENQKREQGLLLFLAVSGSYAYGMPSPESDIDVHGVYANSADSLCGLFPGPKHRKQMIPLVPGVDVEIALHDVGHWCSLLLAQKGNVFEDIFSSSLLYYRNGLAELQLLAMQSMTRGLFKHYQGFALSNNKTWQKDRTVKSLLHTYRLLMTGITVMKEQVMTTSFIELLRYFPHLYALIQDLRARKYETKLALLDEAEVPLHQEYLTALFEDLDDAWEASRLPVSVPVQIQRQLDDFVRRMRYDANSR